MESSEINYGEQERESESLAVKERSKIVGDVGRNFLFQIQNLLEQARDENLASRLIDRLDGDDSSCIRLLVCKISPVIKAAQYSLKNKSQDKWHRMTSWLPNKDEFEENSDECENTHTDCSLFF